MSADSDRLNLALEENIIVWGLSIPRDLLSQTELNYIEKLPNELPDMDWVCGELDRIWIQFNLDNSKAFVGQPISEYYSHPVWMMNGVFSASDPASLSHRNAIAIYLKNIKPNAVADYGGGFGQLALSIAKYIPDTSIHIIEPYPSKVGLHRLLGEPQIHVVSHLSINIYDAIVAQDVLEHVEDPIQLAFGISESVCIQGRIIFANCFSPVIQSHLPSTFHLRYTFPYVMKALGLRFIGRVHGAEHAQIFERVGNLSLPRARAFEFISKIIGPTINWAYPILSILYRSLRNVIKPK